MSKMLRWRELRLLRLSVLEWSKVRKNIVSCEGIEWTFRVVFAKKLVKEWYLFSQHQYLSLRGLLDHLSKEREKRKKWTHNIRLSFSSKGHRSDFSAKAKVTSLLSLHIDRSIDPQRRVQAPINVDPEI